jgi:hypothetical protein
MDLVCIYRSGIQTVLGGLKRGCFEGGALGRNCCLLNRVEIGDVKKLVKDKCKGILETL